MSRTTVTGPDGTRWTVRSRRTRVPQCFLGAPRGTDDALDVLLGGALGRLPLPAGHPALALADAREGDDLPEVSLPEVPSWRHLWHLCDIVTVWRDTRRPDAPGRRWMVTLEVRGRIRRGASWVLDESAGADAADRAGEQVAAAVAAGRLPDPGSATPLDAWDRRPNHPGVYC